MGKKFMGLGGTDHFWDRAKAWILNQITSAVAAKIAEVVANAPEDLDTLKEIADWISAHADDAAAMNTQITENKNNIAANASSISAMNTQIQANAEAIAGKADKVHTHTKSEITDFPTSLKNPNALTVNGKTYDGSSAVNAGVQTVENGGTGVTTAQAAADLFIGSLPADDGVPVDTDFFISQEVNGGPFVPAYERRPISKLWEYIKGKISSVLGLTKDNYDGKAATADTATTATTANKVANALTVNGKTYDGSSAVDAGVQTVANGGTGASNGQAAFENITFGVRTSAKPADNETMLFRSSSWYKTTCLDFWNYIKGKISNVLGLTKDNYGGKSAKSSFLDEYVGAGGTRLTSGNIVPKDSSEYGGMRKDVVTVSMTGSGRPGLDGHLLTMFWDNSGRYDSQFFVSNDGNHPGVKVRYKSNGTDYGAWVDIATSAYARIPIGAPSSLEDGCIWIER